MSDQPPEPPPPQTEDFSSVFKPSGNVVAFPTPESIPAKRARGRPRKDGEPPHQSPEVELAEAAQVADPVYRARLMAEQRKG